MIRIWDIKTRQERAHLAGHSGSVTTLAWDAKNNTLVSGSFDTTVRLWQLRLESGDRISLRPDVSPSRSGR